MAFHNRLISKEIKNTNFNRFKCKMTKKSFLNRFKPKISEKFLSKIFQYIPIFFESVMKLNFAEFET